MKKYRFMALREIARYEPQMRKRGVSAVARSPRGFLTAYKRSGGAKRLSAYWRQRREGFIKRHLAQYKKNRERAGGRRWLALVAWAYKPGRGRR